MVCFESFICIVSYRGTRKGEMFDLLESKRAERAKMTVDSDGHQRKLLSSIRVSRVKYLNGNKLEKWKIATFTNNRRGRPSTKT